MYIWCHGYFSGLGGWLFCVRKNRFGYLHAQTVVNLKPKEAMSVDQNNRARIGRLHVLTDYYFQQHHSHSGLARLAISGGADTIQFRQKFGLIRHRLNEAKTTADVCISTNTTLIIDDDIALALAVGASGVHLGLQDFPLREARRILGEHRLIGASATTLDQAISAQDKGVDYIGFGPVYATRSKANPAAVKGLKALSDVCAALTIPVIAIAGISVDRVEAIFDSGAFGLAVMTAITNAADPRSATAEIREKIEKYAV